MNLLQKRIQEASQKYYTDGTSNLSDAEFDSMLEELKKEDPNSPLLGVGHGYKVEADSTPGAKVKHKYGTAGSLDKCHNWKEFPSSQKQEDTWASLKLDGLSVVLYYQFGKLLQALTRGDGTIGIDITEKVKRILPDSIMDKSFTGAVRGEIIMKYNNFELYRNEHPEAKNPRNTAAGLINSKEVSNDLCYLDIVVYTVVGLETATTWMVTYTSMREWLEMNFELCAPAMCLVNGLSEDNMIIHMEQLNATWKMLGYPSDGIVLTNNAMTRDNQELIYTASAFKFKAESKVTKIIGIDWNLTKTKYLVPRINVETVELSGTNVSWATGFNAQNMRDQKLGVGAEVVITKSGEIIPYIEEVTNPIECELPTVCPCCGTELEWNGVHLQCPNLECADANVQDALIWMKHIAPWDGLGDTLKLTYLEEMFGDDITIEKIYEHGNFTQSEIATLRLIKKQEFRRMINALFTNKVKLADAIQALNIPRLGDVTSRKLAQYPDTVKYLIEAGEGHQDIIDCSEQIGEANFVSILDNIHKFRRLQLIYDNIIWEEQKVENKGKVAITGKLSVKRAQFENELRLAGYTPGSISKDTKFLITDNPNSTSSKNAFADANGIEKITEQDFRSKYM